MANELDTIERQLLPLEPMFEQLLRPTGVPAERIIRSVLISCERVPRLLECTPVSVIQGAASFAVLGLEADGFTGQAFLVPFRDKGVLKAQPIVGYKGFSTLGARVGLTITGDVVREGDAFDFEKGTGAFIRHKPLLGAGRSRRIVAAWAHAAAHGRPPIVEVLDIDEILFVRDRSPAFRGGADTPWKDVQIGFPAMAAKTARRRLSRSLPLSVYQMAAAMDEAHEERGRHAYLHPERGVVIDGEAQPLAPSEPDNPQGPAVDMLTRDRFVIQGRETQRRYPTIEQWRSAMLQTIETLKREPALELYELNARYLDEYRREHPHEVAEVGAAFEKKRDS